MRTETVIVNALRGEPQLRDVYGFAWNPGAPDNQLSEASALVAQIEERGMLRTLVVRPRAWYSLARSAARVWFTTAVGGQQVVLDVGEEPDDRADPAQLPSEPFARGDLLARWTNASPYGSQVGGQSDVIWSPTFTPPRGTLALLVLHKVRAAGSVSTLYLILEWLRGVNAEPHRTALALVGAPGQLGARYTSIIGGGIAGQDQPPSTYLARVDNTPIAGGTDAYHPTNFLPPGVAFPRIPTRLGIFDQGANAWDVDVLALGPE